MAGYAFANPPYGLTQRHLRWQLIHPAKTLLHCHRSSGNLGSIHAKPQDRSSTLWPSATSLSRHGGGTMKAALQNYQARMRRGVGYICSDLGLGTGGGGGGFSEFHFH